MEALLPADTVPGSCVMVISDCGVAAGADEGETGADDAALLLETTLEDVAEETTVDDTFEETILLEAIDEILLDDVAELLPPLQEFIIPPKMQITINPITILIMHPRLLLPLLLGGSGGSVGTKLFAGNEPLSLSKFDFFTFSENE
jgi:hypothetical protein